MPTPRNPAMNPMRRVSGVPATIVASRSRPWRSVPKGCSTDGGLRAGAERGRLLLVATTRWPMPTNRASARRRTIPTASEPLRLIWPSAVVSRSIAALRSPIGDARIEEGIEHVEDQRRDAQRHDDGEDDPLDQEVIVLADRVEPERPHAAGG